MTTNVEECGPCPVFASFTLAFAVQLRKKHKKNFSQSAEKPQSEYESKKYEFSYWCSKYIRFMEMLVCSFISIAVEKTVIIVWTNKDYDLYFGGPMFEYQSGG